MGTKKPEEIMDCEVYHTPPEPEPPMASVVMTSGPTGTAWQRHFTDGLWHSTTGLVRKWGDLDRGRNGVLTIYVAPED